MAIATYKDLCIDAGDAHGLARFWGPVLGLDVNLHDDGDADLRRAGEVLVWVNTVPEPKTVKNRLHLDVQLASLDGVLSAGAHVLDEQPRWTVLSDPDGQEFCAFLRQADDERLRAPLYELVQDVTGDADDAHRLAGWWADLLGATAVRDDGFSHLERVAGLPCESLVFQPVPEAKAAKNRVHVDVTTRDVDGVVAAGATVLRPRGEDGLGWTVLVDPEGNEFCAFTVG